jgi:hypothetical protein|tara:strand:+ start:848 stop:1459 length:612 start_codon:yes stop_codon:yes gene_type:complete
MGRAIDLFVTYRFVKLLTTPFEKTDAFKMGIIDKDGFRTKKVLYKQTEQSAYTVLHKLVFNIKRIFAKVPGLRTRLGTYAAALFLLKDTFKEHVEDPDMFEKGLMEYLKQQGVEFDNSIVEEVTLDNGKLSKGIYVLTQDVVTTEAENEIDALEGDEVEVFEDSPPEDTILGVDVFGVVHKKTKQKIYVSSEDIKELDIGDLL